MDIKMLLEISSCSLGRLPRSFCILFFLLRILWPPPVLAGTADFQEMSGKNADSIVKEETPAEGTAAISLSDGQKKELGEYSPLKMEERVVLEETTLEEAYRQNSSAVIELQKGLQALGFYLNCIIDGWFGPLTKAAVMGAQRLLGYKETGRVTAAFFRKITGLDFSDVKDEKIVLRRTTEEDADRQDREKVRRIQAALEARGYSVGVVDGWFGPRTQAAVMAYQRDNSMNVNGAVSASMWKSLTGEEPSFVTVDRGEKTGQQSEAGYDDSSNKRAGEKNTGKSGAVSRDFQIIVFVNPWATPDYSLQAIKAMGATGIVLLVSRLKNSSGYYGKVLPRVKRECDAIGLELGAWLSGNMNSDGTRMRSTQANWDKSVEEMVRAVKEISATGIPVHVDLDNGDAAYSTARTTAYIKRLREAIPKNIRFTITVMPDAPYYDDADYYGENYSQLGPLCTYLSPELYGYSYTDDPSKMSAAIKYMQRQTPNIMPALQIISDRNERLTRAQIDAQIKLCKNAGCPGVMLFRWFGTPR